MLLVTAVLGVAARPGTAAPAAVGGVLVRLPGVEVEDAVGAVVDGSVIDASRLGPWVCRESARATSHQDFWRAAAVKSARGCAFPVPLDAVLGGVSASAPEMGA